MDWAYSKQVSLRWSLLATPHDRATNLITIEITYIIVNIQILLLQIITILLLLLIIIIVTVPAVCAHGPLLVPWLVRVLHDDLAP